MVRQNIQIFHISNLLTTFKMSCIYHQVTILLYSEYSEYLVYFELFFRDTLNFETSHLDRDLLKSRLGDLAFSSFKTYNSSRKPNNLSPEEFESLRKLSNNKNVIQKSGKSNSVGLVDKIVYTNGVKKLLANPRQFTKLNIDPRIIN